MKHEGTFEAIIREIEALVLADHPKASVWVTELGDDGEAYIVRIDVETGNEHLTRYAAFPHPLVQS